MRLWLIALAGLVGCGGSTPEQQARAHVTSSIKTQLDALLSQAKALQAAAPAPMADGWVASRDQASIDEMMTIWKTTRSSYESIEGAVAVLFSDIDVSIDQRYDYFLAQNGPDDDLFDDMNVTGNHAIERILWAPMIPEDVIAYESALPGYVAAAWPANLQEASEFHDELCQKFVDDATTLDTQFAHDVVLDDAAAFRGVIGSMGEQVEKVQLASSAQEESRYSQHTLGDMRGNLAGVQLVFDAFEPWILSKGGATLAASIQAELDRIDAAYSSISGDSIPPVPAGFDPASPSAADLATPYGQLFSLLDAEGDPTASGSAVALLNQAAELLGIPELNQ